MIKRFSCTLYPVVVALCFFGVVAFEGVKLGAGVTNMFYDRIMYPFSMLFIVGIAVMWVGASPVKKHDILLFFANMVAILVGMVFLPASYAGLVLVPMVAILFHTLRLSKVLPLR